MHPMARRDGFTLLEVTIVLLIIVGMLSIAWPRMQTAMSRSDLRNAALVVKRTLASARRQAVESGQQIHVVFSDGSNQIQVCSKLPKSEDRIEIGESSPADFDDIPSNHSSVLLGNAFFSHKPNAKMQDTKSETQTITFYPDGRGTQSEVCLALPEQSYWIKLSIRGLTGGVTIHQMERINEQDKP